MEIDVINAAFDLKYITPGEIEESLEDPYALSVLPDVDHGPKSTRYYLIGKSIHTRCLFLSFVTNGKIANIIFGREATALEKTHYERLQAEF